MLRIPIILLVNLLAFGRYCLATLLYAVTRRFAKKGRRYLRYSVEGSLPFGHAQGLGRFMKADATFLDLRRDIKRIAAADDVAGVVIDPGKLSVGLARGGDVIAQLDTLRAAGKHVVAHGDAFQTSHYIEATAADTILLEPSGRLYTFSPRFEQIFVAELFERHHICAQFIHIGAFKAAASRWVRDEPSTPERLMFAELRDVVTEHVVNRVSERRRLTPDAARALFAAPMDAREAQGHGLVDGEVFRSDLRAWIDDPDQYAARRAETAAKHEPDAMVVDYDEYVESRPRPFRWRPLRPAPHLAIVDLHGIIIQPGLELPGSPVIDPKPVLALLRRLASNPRVSGVILHINSPGGSALSSELIFSAVDRLREKKPVVAYCSDVAASGGYYIAVAADRIVCRPETITGSIGVVAGKFAVGEALARVGVHTTVIDNEDGSEFGSMFSALEPATLERLQRDGRSFYRRFLQRVGYSRGFEKRQLHRWARGRVYMGEDALARGLVDDVGGFEAAVEALRSLIIEDGGKVAADPRLVAYTHTHLTLKDVVRRTAFQATGDLGVMLEPLALAAMLRREPLLALLPRRLEL